MTTRLADKITLTIDQTREASGLSRATIFELIRSGDLKSSKVGGRRLVIVSSLRQLLEGDAAKADAA